MIRKSPILAAMVSISAAGAANAGSCESNLTSSGVPMMTTLSYKSYETIPGLSAGKALSNIAAALEAENANGVRISKGAGTVDATQDTSGSGRMQTWRAVVRKSGNGVRVDLIFATQQGQLTSTSAVRPVLCRVIAAARG
ncbi:hypothetical protein GCM10007874_05220 [Labrys miyagiensis]|uniref:Uncharacterized protein n=1 Tax=Labrys miyagiensis TaxID=346912 RepID=A0ABQ6CAV1_9HYPH|nr:hypothetical protein [Labrys miyagiensis]GLS17507.1 hypothetical protein GCM10007874_05220 [Labrys miyagiensis]